jgi:4-carboxymuconolactone decarboxylase
VDEGRRSLIAVSAAIVRQDRVALVAVLDEAAAAVRAVHADREDEPAVTAHAVEEAILQSHLFVGYPAMIQALTAWRERVAGPAVPASPVDPQLWERRGETVCARVYGGQYRRLRENITRLHPDLDRWMVVDGYGRVLGRPGLDLATRELCIVALLCAQDAPQQLYSHLRGSLNAGAALDEVEATIRLATAGLPPERIDATWRTWQAVKARAAGDGGADATEAHG